MATLVPAGSADRTDRGSPFRLRYSDNWLITSTVWSRRASEEVGRRIFCCTESPIHNDSGGSTNASSQYGFWDFLVLVHFPDEIVTLPRVKFME
jgi:hypothetical protein